MANSSSTNSTSSTKQDLIEFLSHYSLTLVAKKEPVRNGTSHGGMLLVQADEHAALALLALDESSVSSRKIRVKIISLTPGDAVSSFASDKGMTLIGTGSVSS